MGGGVTLAANAMNATSETRTGFSAANGRVSITFSAEAAATKDNESRAIKIQQGSGGFVDCSANSPQWTQPHWGAARERAKAGGMVGLTAEVLKSPGVALRRSGRIAVVEKVMPSASSGGYPTLVVKLVPFNEAAP